MTHLVSVTHDKKFHSAEPANDFSHSKTNWTFKVTCWGLQEGRRNSGITRCIPGQDAVFCQMKWDDFEIFPHFRKWCSTLNQTICACLIQMLAFVKWSWQTEELGSFKDCFNDCWKHANICITNSPTSWFTFMHLEDAPIQAIYSAYMHLINTGVFLGLESTWNYFFVL